MTKKEMKEKLTIKDLEKIMLDNFVNEYGDLYISGLDFSEFDGDVIISQMKVKGNLFQYNQEVGGNLYQSEQKVGDSLYQSNQEVGGDLLQSYQKVSGDLYQNQQNVIGELISYTDQDYNYEKEKIK